MKLITINGETILPIVLYGSQNEPEYKEYHSKVMESKFGLEMNYVECPFPNVSHGQMMNEAIRQTIDSSVKPDYYLWIDSDAIFMRRECLDLIYSFVSNKITLFGHAWQSNHKKGPNGMIPHPYASQATLCFSRELYNKLNRPDCDHWSDGTDEFGGDTAERITYEAEKRGYIISLIYPSHSVKYTTDLGNGCKFGQGNTYGDNLMYHVSRRDLPDSKELFVKKCQEVLDGKYE